ncbi:hypothetical protein WN944_026478 [Citrus x changshan-huyou]|uniref:Uncharacterized protein n=1 Tax=Citrus x changshan-huyou TaxID=2935761 RepID=A0AAP0LT38_9ROSI
MEKHKVLYLETLLQRSGQRPSNLRRYCVNMGELQERAACCYAEPIKIARHEFVEMLLLDACFIVEQFRMSKIDLRDDYYNVFRMLEYWWVKQTRS